MKYTKGPWELLFGDGSNMFIATQEKFVLARTSIEMGDPEASANGYLIAAAPELYEFAKIVQETLTRLHGTVDVNQISGVNLVEMCAHVINKAEGKSASSVATE